MKKLTLFVLLVLVSSSFFSQVNAQRRIARSGPLFTFEFRLNGSYAMNDAFGETIDIPNNLSEQKNYAMKWGKGASFETTVGFGQKRSNRIFLGLEYDNFLNGTNSQVPFFVFSADTPKTSYNIYTASLGYQYLFGADCRNKQTIQLGVTGSLITASSTSKITFDNAFRMGFLIGTGYEVVLDKGHNVGMTLGFKYQLANFFNSDNGIDNLNDGKSTDKNFGPGFKRFIGFIGFNIGIKFYTGVKRNR
ncbi:MAG: hypothetical protein KDC73_04215 [Ignavibacteriae bacterium]|nr:hypothetical protein [Ignavibacteriota bacterium]MCB9244074.1 hypothetical protein [Ignavibacteriales bacterium]